MISYTRLLGIGFIFAALMVLTKIIFLNILNQDSKAVVYGFWLFVILITIACVRRLGFINYLEAILVSLVWIITMFVVDIMVTAQITGLQVFTTLNVWIANLLVPITIFVLHKKRHVRIRHEHAKHGGHH